MRIGVPKETFTGETRVAGSPETVKKLVTLRLEVFVAKGAGKMAFFLDADYKEAGAKLCSQKDAFEAESDTVVCIGTSASSSDDTDSLSEISSPSIYSSSPLSNSLLLDEDEETTF